uniref:Uncharacterized protein n=1 Tax=Knipowitschia caucasica TaxID=637954 RepID=A0AAV2J998_KNICA
MPNKWILGPTMLRPPFLLVCARPGQLDTQNTDQQCSRPVPRVRPSHITHTTPPCAPPRPKCPMTAPRQKHDLSMSEHNGVEDKCHAKAATSANASSFPMLTLLHAARSAELR